MQKKEPEEFYPTSRAAWREWLLQNGTEVERVWLVLYKKESGLPTITYNEAVEEALCFGWIDSIVKKKDEHSRIQYFSRRKPNSGWSVSNKERVARLAKQKLLDPTGKKVIAAAKKSGQWTRLDEANAGIIPADLDKALRKNKEALKNFAAFPMSVKKGILAWISTAKTEITRNKRIEETARLAAENKRANQ
jgi:uncharacterized protein YdeI (YjbR/CyaY-like superfamily)